MIWAAWAIVAAVWFIPVITEWQHKRLLRDIANWKQTHVHRCEACGDTFQTRCGRDAHKQAESILCSMCC